MAEETEVVERLAEHVHEQWRGWMLWMRPSLSEGVLARWQRQMDTSDATRPEEEKESARAEARRMRRVIVGWVAELVRPPAEEDQHV